MVGNLLGVCHRGRGLDQSIKQKEYPTTNMMVEVLYIWNGNLTVTCLQKGQMQSHQDNRQKYGKLWNSITLDCSKQDLRRQVSDKELAKLWNISMTIITLILTTTTQRGVHTLIGPIHQYRKPCPHFNWTNHQKVQNNTSPFRIH